MIVAWMLTYLAVSGLLLVVAFGADAVLTQRRSPRRWTWISAMVAMCVLPLALREIAAPVPLEVLSGSAPSHAVPASPTFTIGPVAQQPTPSTIEFPARPSGNRVVVAPDSPLFGMNGVGVLLWVGSTLLCLALLIGAQVRIVRARRRWQPAPAEITATVAASTGHPTRVWCSDDVGPAAFGLRRPQIVIPAWVTTLDPPARALLLQHEASHVAARDPLLLHAALALVVVMPWNLPLLLAYRWLHRAIEHDCDARVLAATDDARGYGRLLLATAERLTTSSQAHAWARAARWLPAPIPGIGTRRTELEARLRAMVRPVSTWRTRVRMIGAAAVVVAGVLAACSVPSPERMRSDSLKEPGVSQIDEASGVERATRVQDEIAPAPLSSIDTVRTLLSLQSRLEALTPRGMVLVDSTFVAAARTSVPAAFAPDNIEDSHVWLLVDDRLRVLRTATGRQYYDMIVTQPDGKEIRVPVGATRGRVRLSWSKDNFTRAFPGIRADQIGLWSSADTTIGARKVHVVWAQYAAFSSDADSNVANAAPRILRPWKRGPNMLGTEAFREWISQTAAPHARALIAESTTETPVLWLLVNDDGDELANGSGRRGLYGTSQRREASGTTGFAPATALTADKDLGIHCNAFSAKFPAVLRDRHAYGCGMIRIQSNGRDVIVVWGITKTQR